MRVIPVKAKVVGSQALIDAMNERRASRQTIRKAKSYASKLNQEDFGSISQLRELLGLPSLYSSHHVESTRALPQDALIVAFDTEWERHGLVEHVVEIGITALDTRDIANTAPGPSAHNWISKAKTYHYVVDTTRRPTDRMRGCYFSDDMFAGVSTIKQDIMSILRRAAHPPHDPGKPIAQMPRGLRRVVLAGHSISTDVHQMWRSPGLHMDLFSKDVFLTKPSLAFDTVMLAVNAANRGATITSARLGRLVNWLGVHPQYRHNETIMGTHNAGNDSAYSMMALLLFAARWEQIVPGKIVDDEPSVEKNPLPKSSRRNRAARKPRTTISDKRFRRNAQSASQRPLRWKRHRSLLARLSGISGSRRLRNFSGWERRRA